MKTKIDKHDQPIGDGTFHCNYDVMDFSDYPEIQTSVQKSISTESVYVTYSLWRGEEFLQAQCRFSNHTCSAVETGLQLNGRTAKREEVLYRLGFMNRTFVENVQKRISNRYVKKSKVKEFPECPYTIEELYALPVGSDISQWANHIAKDSNILITGNNVYESGTGWGDYKYEYK